MGPCNMTLIGMPEADKSTVGVLLLKATLHSFLEERSPCEKWPFGYLGFSWSKEVQLIVTVDSAEVRASETAYRPLDRLRDGTVGKTIEQEVGHHANAI